jgi:hypothetical protein
MGHFEKYDFNSESVISWFQMGEMLIADIKDGVFPVFIYRWLNSIGYSGLLIPNLPYHKIKAEPAGKFSQCLKQICTACYWRTRFITVNPGYFQWG